MTAHTTVFHNSTDHQDCLVCIFSGVIGQKNLKAELTVFYKLTTRLHTGGNGGNRVSRQKHNISDNTTSDPSQSLLCFCLSGTHYTKECKLVFTSDTIRCHPVHVHVQRFAVWLSTGEGKWAVALKCLIRLGCLVQRLTVCTVATVYSHLLIALDNQPAKLCSNLSSTAGSLRVNTILKGAPIALTESHHVPT